MNQSGPSNYNSQQQQQQQQQQSGRSGPVSIEGPDEPEVFTDFQPDAMARIHFLIHSSKMINSIAKAFPACMSTGMAKTFLQGLFPNLPSKIDLASHTEMKYPVNEKQKKTVDEWIAQFYTVMGQKVKDKQTGRERAVSDYFYHRQPEGWGIVIEHIKMVGMLNLGQKWPQLTAEAQDHMWRFMDMLYVDAKQFMGFRNVDKIIPRELKEHIASTMQQNGGPSQDNPFGFSPSDAQQFMANMDPAMMQKFMGSVFSNPEQTQTVVQSVSDMMGGDTIANLLQSVLNTQQQSNNS